MHKDISIWMPLYIGDLQAKFARMTAEQIGAALLLMMDFWKNGAIPHDLATVCSITKLPQHTKAKTLLNTLMALELFEVESEQIHSNFLSSLKSQALQNQQMKSESYRVCRRPTFPEIRSIASQGNIEQNEVYMIFIMLSESNEFGKKVRGDMAFVRSGNNCNEKLCYCALYKCARLCATFCV